MKECMLYKRYLNVICEQAKVSPIANTILKYAMPITNFKIQDKKFSDFMKSFFDAYIKTWFAMITDFFKGMGVKDTGINKLMDQLEGDLKVVFPQMQYNEEMMGKIREQLSKSINECSYAHEFNEDGTPAETPNANEKIYLPTNKE